MKTWARDVAKNSWNKWLSCDIHNSLAACYDEGFELLCFWYYQSLDVRVSTEGNKWEALTLHKWYYIL